MRKNIFFLLLVFSFSITSVVYSQVKIGNNPSQIDGNSILELESTNKVLVISRVSNTQMLTIKPLRGAIVYNTDEKCVFMYNGANWRSLCGSSSNIKVTTNPVSPTDNNIGDFWINNTRNNATSIWNGTNWVAIDNSPIKADGAPDDTKVPNPIAGDVYVDQETGSIYAYDGNGWVNSKTNISANNGLLINADNTIQLGGTIIKPTIIQTDATNTFGITGLQEGDVTKEDLLTVDKNTGEFKKISSSSLFREEVAVLKAEVDGAKQFSPPLPITDSKKVNVYRNGVRIDFTVINNTTIEVEPEAVCYKDDEIRIVQFY